MSQLEQEPGPAGGDFASIKARLIQSAHEHQTLDGWAFNLGTITILVLTAASTLCASNAFGGDTAWLGAIFAAIAGVLVAADRTLAFSARWRYHHDMRNGYLGVLDEMELASLLSGEERETRISEASTVLRALRSRESQIPGSGAASQ